MTDSRLPFTVAWKMGTPAVQGNSLAGFQVRDTFGDAGLQKL